MDNRAHKGASVRYTCAMDAPPSTALALAIGRTADPLADVRAAPDRTPAHEKRQPMAPSELAALLTVATAPADRVLILLAGHAGLRAGELTALCWEDVDLPAQRLVVLAGKGGTRRTVGLSKSLTTALAAQRPEPATGLVLGLPSRFAAWRRLRVLAARAGVPARGVHALRHTAGTRLYREQRDLALVAAHLGHAGLDTARIYAKLAADDVERAVADW